MSPSPPSSYCHHSLLIDPCQVVIVDFTLFFPPIFSRSFNKCVHWLTDRDHESDVRCSNAMLIVNVTSAACHYHSGLRANVFGCPLASLTHTASICPYRTFGSSQTQDLAEDPYLFNSHSTQPPSDITRVIVVNLIIYGVGFRQNFFRFPL